MIQAEIESILHYAVSWNSVQESAGARRDLLDSWRQVAETLLSQTPPDLLPASSKQQILLQLLQTLLNKISGDSLVSGMDSIVSSTILLLMTSLRQTYTSTPDKQDIMGDTFVGILDNVNLAPGHSLLAYLRIGKSSTGETGKVLELSERGKLQKSTWKLFSAMEPSYWRFCPEIRPLDTRSEGC